MLFIENLPFFPVIVPSINLFHLELIILILANSNPLLMPYNYHVRKISHSIDVERIFPLNSPFIEKIEVNKKGKVRRSKIFYLRELRGKKARIKEIRD